jgi:hypothetical protein
MLSQALKSLGKFDDLCLRIARVHPIGDPTQLACGLAEVIDF